MDLCSTGHEEVCYETRLCPACEKLLELEGRVTELEAEVAELEDKIQEASNGD